MLFESKFTINGINLPTFAVYEKMQFRAATSNNGKRRSLQEFYIIVLELYANCTDGTKQRLVTTESERIVVRGRSPGHYAESERTKRERRMSEGLPVRHPRLASMNRRASSLAGSYTSSPASLQVTPNQTPFFSADLSMQSVSSFGYLDSPVSSMSSISVPQLPGSAGNLFDSIPSQDFLTRDALVSVNDFNGIDTQLHQLSKSNQAHQSDPQPADPLGVPGLVDYFLTNETKQASYQGQ